MLGNQKADRSQHYVVRCPAQHHTLCARDNGILVAEHKTAVLWVLGAEVTSYLAPMENGFKRPHNVNNNNNAAPFTFSASITAMGFSPLWKSHC